MKKTKISVCLIFCYCANIFASGYGLCVTPAGVYGIIPNCDSCIVTAMESGTADLTAIWNSVTTVLNTASSTIESTNTTTGTELTAIASAIDAISAAQVISNTALSATIVSAINGNTSAVSAEVSQREAILKQLNNSNLNEIKIFIANMLKLVFTQEYYHKKSSTQTIEKLVSVVSDIAQLCKNIYTYTDFEAQINGHREADVSSNLKALGIKSYNDDYLDSILEINTFDFNTPAVDDSNYNIRSTPQKRVLVLKQSKLDKIENFNYRLQVNEFLSKI